MPVKPGTKLKRKDPAQWKENVSKSRQEFAAKHLAPIPDEKRCTKCRKIKPQSEYRRVKRYVKTLGREREYLYPHCRECERKKANNRTKEQVREYNRRAREKIKSDPEKAAERREYQREWAAAKRRELGAKPIGSRKVKEGPRSDMLPIELIQNFLIVYFDNPRAPDIETLSARSGVPVERIRRIISGYEAKGTPLKEVTTGVVDRLLIAADAQEVFHELYPVD